MGREPVMADYRLQWQATDKVVYSTTMAEPVGERAVLRSAFDADEVAVLKETATRPLSIGGPTLA